MKHPTTITTTTNRKTTTTTTSENLKKIDFGSKIFVSFRSFFSLCLRLCCSLKLCVFCKVSAFLYFWCLILLLWWYSSFLLLFDFFLHIILMSKTPVWVVEETTTRTTDNNTTLTGRGFIIQSKTSAYTQKTEQIHKF